MPINDDDLKPEKPPGPVVRDHRGEPNTNPSGFAPPKTGWGDMPGATVRDHRIKHVFVLMLENRSFDHMLGFSGITGTDATHGGTTAIDGLTGKESNTFLGVTHTVATGAPETMDPGPGHDFASTVEQLCGDDVKYPQPSGVGLFPGHAPIVDPGGPYPPIDNSGFAASYARAHGKNPGDALLCLGPDQVPVITALAREFVVCDRWFSSMPGPTEPNRYFAHMGTSEVYDDSPSNIDIGRNEASPGGGVRTLHGNIFQKLAAKGVRYRIYAGDDTPNVAELYGVSIATDIRDYDDFAGDVASASYDAGYTFIEPSYDPFNNYRNGSSQHPSGTVLAGEALIVETYEAIRSSPVWNESLLLITWDEHGGFYDHVAPGPCTKTGSIGFMHGFPFDRLGLRVPAVIISPLFPKNLICHTQFEHSSIPATVIKIFGLDPMNDRVTAANTFDDLLTLPAPRIDAPMSVTARANATPIARRIPIEETVTSMPDASIFEGPGGNVSWHLRAILAAHLQLVAPSEQDAVRARAATIETFGELLAYQKEVAVLVKAAQAKARLSAPAAAPVNA